MMKRENSFVVNEDIGSSTVGVYCNLLCAVFSIYRFWNVCVIKVLNDVVYIEHSQK